ncbi:hypothetical protein [Clostridium sardiniense]|uniref:hypothetical protein n=1 Tax=Clostridium sardiniense TaxID=29369 RepID=UPI003D35604A
MLKKKLFISLLTITVLSLFYILFVKSNITKENIDLKNQIIKSIDSSAYLDLSKITKFDWDTLFAFNPYSNPRDILKDENVTTYNKNFNISHDENIVMLGFIKDNKLVEFINLPRMYGYKLTSNSKFKKDDSIFKVLPVDKTLYPDIDCNTIDLNNI